ncbi:MAG: hypothetical protein LBH46_00430 [Rickettsiales bacterium]|nr:hypothetical protein [Rickettsiales bacterium]
MFVNKIDRDLFRRLEGRIVEMGGASDKDSFEVIKERLVVSKIFSPREFAEEVIYVILASGFRQKTAKGIFDKIREYLDKDYDFLIKIFNNKNKINAIIDIWHNKEEKTKEFYSLKTDEDKLDFLGKLKHIGNITKNHLARNLGINLVKYDIWIQRLAVGLYGKKYFDKIDNGNLKPEIRILCDKMFFELEQETKEKRGYIDVVLWKSCSLGLLKISSDGLVTSEL